METRLKASLVIASVVFLLIIIVTFTNNKSISGDAIIHPANVCEARATSLGLNKWSEFSSAEECHTAASEYCRGSIYTILWNIPNSKNPKCCIWECGEISTPCEETSDTVCNGKCDVGTCRESTIGVCYCDTDSIPCELSAKAKCGGYCSIGTCRPDDSGGCRCETGGGGGSSPSGGGGPKGP